MIARQGRRIVRLGKRVVARLLGAVGIRLGGGGGVTLNTELLDELDPFFRSRLLSMYGGEPQAGTDGKKHAVDNVTRISPEEGMWIYQHCVSAKPESTLEMGQAFGYSTVYFMAALAKNKKGAHTAVDPSQTSYFHGIGAAHAQAAVEQSKGRIAFRSIEERSDAAAIDLTRAGSTFDVILVDGNHRFDDVLVDFYLCAPLCTVGGHIVLHDMWMSSIHTVASFIRNNRSDFEWVPTPAGNLGVFRKLGEDDRHYKHFRKFEVFGDQD